MTIQEAVPARARPGLRQSFAALAEPNYRRYFFGAVISMAGTWMQTTAQAWLVLELTNSPVALATVTTLQFMPIMLFTLFGGAFADRFPRRRLMLGTMSLGALQAGTLGLLTYTHTVQIWHVYILATSLGLINALDSPLRQAFVAELVGRERLANAVALNAITQNVGRMLGPAAAGVVISLFGTSTAFFINFVSFFGVIIALLLIDVSRLYPGKVGVRHGTMLHDVGHGLAFARRTPPVLFLIVLAAFVGTFGFNSSTVVPLVATYLVHATASQFGILNSCLGCGAVLAALTLTSMGRPTSARILIASLMFGLGLIGVGMSTNFPLTSALFLVIGFSSVTYTTSTNASLQLLAPDDMRGRVASMFHLLIAGTSPIGAQITGAMSHTFSVGAACALNGAMCCIGVGVALFYRMRARSG